MYRLNPEILDRAREMHDLTSDEKLAAKINVSSSSIRNWRKGIKLPSVARLMILRDLTGVPLDNLLIPEENTTAAA